jgi:hypothetical protein
MKDKVLNKLKEQEDDFKSQVEALDDVAEKGKLEEVEPQTKLSQKEISKAKEIYLKPKVALPCRSAFNEKFRADWNFQKELVQFIAEHREIIGENIEIWTKKFQGTPYEYWEVPTGKPVWGPRYLAEQIKNCNYRRLVMNDTPSHIDPMFGGVQFSGNLVVDKQVQRLDALPVSNRKSIFMGAI